ncbi:MAG: hypothetical protein ACFFCQ_10325 [Promethearchaeota archaeon]
MVKRFLRKKIDRGARLRQYFLRGHASWFALAFSLINFTLITYNFSFKNLYFVPDILKRFSIYFVLFIVSYFPIAAIVGYLDFKKGTYRAEQELTREISPVWSALFQEIEEIKEHNKKILTALQEKEQ